MSSILDVLGADTDTQKALKTTMPAAANTRAKMLPLLLADLDIVDQVSCPMLKIEDRLCSCSPCHATAVCAMTGLALSGSPTCHAFAFVRSTLR